MKHSKRHPIIDRHLQEIKEKLRTMTINAVGKEYGIDSTTMWRFAKIYKMKGVDVKTALSCEWTDDMLRILRMKFHKTFNAELAKQLRVSPRTLIRKARELGLQKEEGFLEKRRAIITEMAKIARPKNDAATIARLTEAGIPFRFKKGQTRPVVDYSKIWKTRRANEQAVKEALKNPY